MKFLKLWLKHCAYIVLVLILAAAAVGVLALAGYCFGPIGLTAVIILVLSGIVAAVETLDP